MTDAQPSTPAPAKDNGAAPESEAVPILPRGVYLPPENLARIDTHPIRPKLGQRPNPTDYTISLRSKFGTDQQLLHPGARRQSMRGFEAKYTDIVDFIVRATHYIWEEKNVGYIYDHYRHNINVVDDYGLAIGRDKVIAGTLQFINAFPDIRILADEIIWAGDDEVGFYTSHRAVIKATNTGYSVYGPPTGKAVEFWLVANCIFIANENYEEWVIYNHASIILQLGFDLRAKARELGNQANLNGLKDQRFGESQRLLGQGKPAHLAPKQTDGFDVEDFIRRTYHYIWNWRMVGKVREVYAPGLRFFGPSDRTLYGTGEYQSFVLSMLAMFPDLELTIDDLYWMGNEVEGYRVSVRWSLVGTHTGLGVYGPPTDRRIYMWGITQNVVENGRITEEWMMFNEFQVMQQIYRD
ncbi:MAG: ester cyclase [Anaerolineales bacterium]